MRVIALVIAFTCSSCTLLGPVVGGAYAASVNDGIDKQHKRDLASCRKDMRSSPNCRPFGTYKPPEHPVGSNMVGGLLIGMLIDVALFVGAQQMLSESDGEVSDSGL